MSLNRTGQTERNIDDIIAQITLRQHLAIANKSNRYRKRKLDPYLTKILELYYRDQSLTRIQLALSSGLIGNSIKVGKTTIHDYIKSHTHP